MANFRSVGWNPAVHLMIDPLEAALKEEGADPLADLVELEKKVVAAYTGSFKIGDFVRLRDSAFDHVVFRVLDTYTTGEGKIPMLHAQITDVPAGHIWGPWRDFIPAESDKK